MTKAEINRIIMGINKPVVTKPKTVSEMIQDKGVGYLQQLNIFKPYIRSFKAKDRKVCFFENFAGYWDYQEKQVMAKRKELEADGEHMVYAITHEGIGDCETWTFLIASKDEQDLTYVGNGMFEAFAYVWNKDYDMESEYGYIMVRSFGGGIKRVY